MKLAALTPMAFVKSVPRSIEFYAKLGFDVANTFTPPGHDEPSWAWLTSGRAQLMVTCGEDPPTGAEHTVLFYVYSQNTKDAREELIAKGVDAGEICYPPYAPQGEFKIVDPDGFVVMVSHT